MKNSIIAQFKQTRYLLKIARAIQEMSKPLRRYFMLPRRVRNTFQNRGRKQNPHTLLAGMRSHLKMVP